MSCQKPRTGPHSRRHVDPSSVERGPGPDQPFGHQPQDDHLGSAGQTRDDPDHATSDLHRYDVKVTPEFLVQLVDTFPPLRPAQRDRLRSIFANRRRVS